MNAILTPMSQIRLQTTEEDLMTKASSMEAMSLRTLEGDRRLRQQAPPVDWESVAAEGAQKFWEQWEAEPGEVSRAPTEDALS